MSAPAPLATLCLWLDYARSGSLLQATCAVTGQHKSLANVLTRLCSQCVASIRSISRWLTTPGMRVWESRVGSWPCRVLLQGAAPGCRKPRSTRFVTYYHL